MRPEHHTLVSPFSDEVLCPVGELGGEGVELERGEGDEAEVEESGGEAQEPQRRRPACKPTTDEVRAHRVSHLPFRDWCPECVAGRAKDWPHTKRDVEETLTVPEVSLDYCFIRETAGEDYSVVLVGKDRETKLILSHVAPCKGGISSGSVSRCAGTSRSSGSEGA